ncbi:MAG: class I fructose-bisphosphate aldolase [Armatimonadota bacterium]
MEGQWIRLNRLFSEGGRAILVALDGGVFAGPVPGLGNLPETADDFRGADAVIVSPGMMRHCGHAFDYRGAPLAAVRLNWPTSRRPVADYTHSACGTLSTPASAQAVGADLCVASLCLGGHDEQVDAAAVEKFAALVRQKRECGLPLIAEWFPGGSENLPPGRLAERVHEGTRMAAELGADAVITYTVADELQRTVNTCPIPVIAAHVRQTADTDDLLQMAAQATEVGARGVVMRGACLDAPDVPAMIKAVCRVLKDEVDPDTAAEEAGLSE